MPVGDPKAAHEFLTRVLAVVSELRQIYENDAVNYYASTRWKAGDAEAQRLLPAAIKVGKAVDQAVGDLMAHAAGTYDFPWENLLVGIQRALGVLDTEDEIAAIVEPMGPRLLAGDLHPVVWTAAAQLWDDGHRRLALQTAATMIDAQLKAKLDVLKPSDYDLVTMAFNPNPKSGAKVLRFTQYPPGSADWNSAHQGAMAFGQGCMLAIRNLSTHRPVEPDPQLALEQLAALSVLARWIDETEVQTAD